ncbi:MAG TPA: sigma-70 family RNA polymerase sigma factor [Bacteroidia bacterium]|nr:sigma-70 family RNA polymerase sigma factor [Bacteroidia bacterium]
MDQQKNTHGLDPKEWVNKYSGYLVNYAYYRVNDKDLAEDLVQDAFLSALKAIQTFKGAASEKTWLTAILKNKIIDHYKKASTKKESPLQLNTYTAPNYDHFFNEEKMGHWQSNATPMDWKSSEYKVERSEFQEMLDRCLEKLPVKWKGIFSLCILEEGTAKEVCKEFNITSSNFWVIMHRSKLQIRECIEKNWIKVE